MLNFMIIPLSQTNCFLINTPKGYLLVDCGYIHNEILFKKYLIKLNIDLSDISYVLLTHHHNDHCGLLPFLKKTNPDIRVIMSKLCADYLQKSDYGIAANAHYSNPKLGCIINLYTKFRKISPDLDPYFTDENDIIISDDNYPLSQDIGIEGQIILTPGHTDDSISLILGEYAFIGDAARNMLMFTGTPYQPILIEDIDACYLSWKKIKKSGAKILYPSHGSHFVIEKLPIK